MKDLMGLMKQVKDMQARMGQMQEELAAATVEGQSGGGMVKVVMNGKAEMQTITIDPTLMQPDETEILEDLIIAAAADAKSKAEAHMQDKMKDVTGGLPIPPGMKLF